MIVKCLEISTRSFEGIRTSIFRIGPRGMKFFNIIKIDKTLTSRTVLKVIDPKKADFWVIFFRKTPPSDARGRIADLS